VNSVCERVVVNRGLSVLTDSPSRGGLQRALPGFRRYLFPVPVLKEHDGFLPGLDSAEGRELSL